ncbi:MJ0042-type zinc finger domain-containing protein [Haloferula sp.]|uniref:MJ0042-type zinc finger domain-containing protein n=1 Tax=Haloferula sp. TaxID=2497595 RepID=UPI003C78F3E8
MHVATCQHCHTEFEVDEETIAFLQGRSHFKCPTCSKLLPVSILPAPMVSAAPLVQAPVVPEQVSVPMVETRQVEQKVSRGLSRNFLILGAAVILALGGLGFYFATRQSGDRSIVVQDVTNEIIRNQYFTGLVDQGRAELEALEQMARIEPMGPAYIGLSADGYSWSEAQDFAKKAGGEILAVESATDRSAPWSDPSTERLVRFLDLRFPEVGDRTVWVRQNSSDYPRVLNNPDVRPISTPEQPRRVFVRWWPKP